MMLKTKCDMPQMVRQNVNNFDIRNAFTDATLSPASTADVLPVDRVKPLILDGNQLLAVASYLTGMHSEQESKM